MEVFQSSVSTEAGKKITCDRDRNEREQSSLFEKQEDERKRGVHI